MRTIAILLCGLLCQAVIATPEVIETDAQRKVMLANGHTRLSLEEIKKESGCMPSGCATFVDGRVIMRDSGLIRDAKSRSVKLQVLSAPAPELDWDPFGLYRVRQGKKTWGSCVEFSHAGVGQSGTFQRWRSVILLPKAARTAYRFVGYWISCEDLFVGESSEIVLAHIAMQVDSAGSAPLPRIVQAHCNTRRCKSVVDPRRLRFAPDSASGALLLGE